MTSLNVGSPAALTASAAAAAVEILMLKVEFVSTGRLPMCPPDPAYPDGVDFDTSQGREPTCSITFPKVTTCGLFLISCDECKQRVVLTAAGRPDDPRSVKLACRITRH